ncbi:MAG: lipopolysaccharide biosynthesis protein [Ardenticatenaceae bacterium]
MVNVIAAGLGFVQGIVTARILGPEPYGIIAVIAGVNITVLNFLDIRLVDLAGKLYYRSELPNDVEQRAYQSSILQVCLIGNGIISLFLCSLGGFVSWLTIHWFTASYVRWEWLLAHAVVLALTNWTNTFAYLQRFSGKFYLMGTWKLITQVITISTFLPIIILYGNLDGYYTAQVTVSSIATLMTIGLSLFIWRKYEGFTLLNRQMFLSLPDYWHNLRFLFFGNLLGYTKLFHRAADVLLIGYFSDDRTTGLYKFARSLTDSLYILFDALNQVYLPRFLELLAQRAHVEYRQLATRLLIGTGLFTVALIAIEGLLLPWVIKIALANRFAGVEGAVMVLTLPFFFVAGIYIWVWPIFIHFGQLGKYTIFNYLACLAQYSLVILLFFVFEPTASQAALGYLVYYLVLMPGALFLVHRKKREVLPNLPFQPTSG